MQEHNEHPISRWDKVIYHPPEILEFSEDLSELVTEALQMEELAETVNQLGERRRWEAILSIAGEGTREEKRRILLRRLWADRATGLVARIKELNPELGQKYLRILDKVSNAQRRVMEAFEGKDGTSEPVFEEEPEYNPILFRLFPALRRYFTKAKPEQNQPAAEPGSTAIVKKR